MKKFVTTLSLIFSISTLAAEALKENFCTPQPDSKRYIINDFHAPYPKTVKFECTYECLVNGRLEIIVGTSTVNVTSMDSDARDVVCQGVNVKKVSWGYDFDGVIPFYAFATQIRPIKKFAFANINQNNKTEKEFLEKLKLNINIVVSAYISTKDPHFVAAGYILDQVAKELPDSTKTLDKYITMIVKKNGKVAFDSTAESLVVVYLNAAASWRVPSHQFNDVRF